MRQRRKWFAGQLDLDPRKLVFIDETGAKPAKDPAMRSIAGWPAEGSANLARKGGRCRRGRRLRAGVPDGHYKTVTLVAALRLRGLTAPKVYDRPINAALFEV